MWRRFYYFVPFWSCGPIFEGWMIACLSVCPSMRRPFHPCVFLCMCMCARYFPLLHAVLHAHSLVQGETVCSLCVLTLSNEPLPFYCVGTALPLDEDEQEDRLGYIHMFQWKDGKTFSSGSVSFPFFSFFFLFDASDPVILILLSSNCWLGSTRLFIAMLGSNGLKFEHFLFHSSVVDILLAFVC